MTRPTQNLVSLASFSIFLGSSINLLHHSFPWPSPPCQTNKDLVHLVRPALSYVKPSTHLISINYPNSWSIFHDSFHSCTAANNYSGVHDTRSGPRPFPATFQQSFIGTLNKSVAYMSITSDMRWKRNRPVSWCNVQPRQLSGIIKFKANDHSNFRSFY